MKKSIIILSLLLTVPFAVLQAQHEVDYEEEYEEYDDEPNFICQCTGEKVSEITKLFIDKICGNPNLSEEEMDYYISKGADINVKFKVYYEGEDFDDEDDSETVGRQATRPIFYLYGDALRYSIEKGADVNVRDEDDNTLLVHLLKYSSDIDLIRLLLENGADPNIGSIFIDEQNYYTLLEYAAFRGETEIIELLIKYGANAMDTRAHLIIAGKIKEYNFFGERINDEQEAEISWTIVQRLLENGADINKSYDGDYLLTAAISNHKFDMVVYLVEQGANPTLDDFGYLAFIWRHPDIPESQIIKDYIYALTENIDDDKRRDYLPLHIAIDKRDLKTVKQIINENPAEAKAIDKNGNTTLHVLFYSYYCEAEYHSRAYELIRKKQAETEKNMQPMLELLLKNGVDVNAANINGKTPLHAAVAEYTVPKNLLSVLLTHSVDINAKDKFGKTPLHYVKSSEAAEFLIKNGAELNVASTVLQRTPMHEAARNSSPSLVSLLIQAGADENAKDKYGSTPSDIWERMNLNPPDTWEEEKEPELFIGTQIIIYTLLVLSILTIIGMAVLAVKRINSRKLLQVIVFIAAYTYILMYKDVSIDYHLIFRYNTSASITLLALFPVLLGLLLYFLFTHKTTFRIKAFLKWLVFVIIWLVIAFVLCLVFTVIIEGFLKEKHTIIPYIYEDIGRNNMSPTYLFSYSLWLIINVLIGLFISLIVKWKNKKKSS